MSDLLKKAAVSCLKGDEAKEILGAYLETKPGMVHNQTPGAAHEQPAPKPR